MNQHYSHELYDKCRRVARVCTEGQAKVALKYIDRARRAMLRERACKHIIHLLVALEVGLWVKIFVCEGTGHSYGG